MIESSAESARRPAPVTPRRPDGPGMTIVIDVLPESVRWLMSLPKKPVSDGR